MRRLWGILLLVAAAAGIAGLPGSARASFGGANGKILYLDRTTAATLRAVDPNGSGAQTVRMPVRDGSPFLPTWSPDGRSIAFVAHPSEHAEDPWLLDVRMDNGTVYDVAACDDLGSISWSPNGSKLMYICDGRTSTVFADGTYDAQTVNVEASTVSWSPDGSRVAYDRYDGSVWVANLDGTNAVELGAPSPTACGTSLPIEGSGPHWSPDGSMIADDCRGVTVYETDGSGSWLIDRNGASPTWAPDGTRLAYANWDASTNDWGIVTVSPTGGSEQTVLAPSAGIRSDLDWGRVPPAPRTSSPPRLITPPTIRGTAVYDTELYATTGTWSGDPVRTFNGKWQRCDADGGNCVDIPDADSYGFYITVADDVDHRLRFVVTATNTAGSTTTSVTTGVVGRGKLPTPIAPTVAGRPQILGTARVGSELSTAPGTWNGDPPISYAYQWQRCDRAGANCTDVHGATAGTYTAQPADAGSRLRVSVTASNKGGHLTSASDATDVVQAMHSAPTIRSVHASWAKHRIRLTLTACSADGAALRASATDQRLHRTFSWAIPGCRASSHMWAASRKSGLAHVIVVHVRDARGLTSNTVRLTLR